MQSKKKLCRLTRTYGTHKAKGEGTANKPVMGYLRITRFHLIQFCALPPELVDLEQGLT
ncbi:hypothetical protein [Shewanella polaris]|uniref:hypothetical protein n=1 Tax=Shewanella polaris TaxID=2588449 RepID=UPI00142EC177|nr:hypothetical protein [Shewanella polaris]